MPIADRLATDATVLATGQDARVAFARARAEWQTLTAAALTGIGVTAQSIALEYVNERHQFGRPIGAFQALQQQLADLPIAIDGARLLSYKAAWAGDRDEPGVVDVDFCDVTEFDDVGVDGVPVRERRGGARDRPQPALPRRLRVRRGVRHPAVLPAGARVVAGRAATRPASACTWPTRLFGPVRG